jgi:hypothetical protein
MVAAPGGQADEQEQPDRDEGHDGVEAQQHARAQDDVQPGCRAAAAQAAQRQPGRQRGQRDERADLHAEQSPVVERRVEGGQRDRARPWRAAPTGEFVGQLAHEHEIHGRQGGTGELDEQADLGRRDRQPVQPGHVQHQSGLV